MYHLDYSHESVRHENEKSNIYNINLINELMVS